MDDESEVVEAVYAEPGIMTPIILANLHTYLAYLSTALCADPSSPSPSSKPVHKPKSRRALIKMHLAFAAHHVCVAANDAGVTERVFRGVVFPFVMYSKARQNTAEGVWEIIDADADAKAAAAAGSKGSKGGRISECDWLGGCVDVWRAEKEKEKEKESTEGRDDHVSKMAAMNLALAGKIAGTLSLVITIPHLSLLFLCSPRYLTHDWAFDR